AVAVLARDAGPDPVADYALDRRRAGAVEDGGRLPLLAPAEHALQPRLRPRDPAEPRRTARELQLLPQAGLEEHHAPRRPLPASGGGVRHAREQRALDARVHDRERRSLSSD